jgi:hypothetical protein
MKSDRVVCVLCLAGALAAPGFAQQQGDADLKRQIEELQTRVQQLEKAAPTPPPAEAEPPPPKTNVYNWEDFTWVNGNSREHVNPLDSKYFTPQLMLDANYTYSFNRPQDHTLDGVCEVGRVQELQVQQIGVGGDLHVGNVRGRLMTQFGMYSQMTPRNDASPSRGQWNLGNAYQYISEANAGYHFDVKQGLNVDAGIFMSYVGLFSYYQNENWAYSPSYVSANTPWFFNGVRVQYFPTEHLKIEPWFINGWQSYGMFNEAPGLGGQILWRPTRNFQLISNNYYGYDTLGLPNRMRVHTDNSVEVKYLDRPQKTIDKGAFSVTVDAGCETGEGVSCTPAGSNTVQSFLGFMLYNRLWFHHDKFAITTGGGAINNPGRYLVLLPPINGATASTGSPYFPQNPGTEFKAWDASFTFDYMPDDWLTWRAEYNHRNASVPYFAGPGGMTPAGGNTGTPGVIVPGFTPDLRRTENRVTVALLMRI